MSKQLVIGIVTPFVQLPQGDLLLELNSYFVDSERPTAQHEGCYCVARSLAVGRLPSVRVTMKMRGLRRKKTVASDSNSSNSSSNNNNNANESFKPRRRKGLPHILSSPLMSRQGTRDEEDARSRGAASTWTCTTSNSSISSTVPDEEMTATGSSSSTTMDTTRRLALVTPERSLVTRPPNPTQNELHASWESWLDAVGALTPHVQHLAACSAHLALHAGQWAFHTAVIMPVTLPTRVLHHVVSHAVPLLLQATPLLSHSSHDDEGELDRGGTTATQESTHPHYDNNINHHQDLEQDENDNPIVAVVRGAWELPGNVWGLAHHHLANLLLGEEELCSNQDYHHKDVLERLRLDYNLPPEEEPSLPAKTTNFLLRVDDLGLYHYQDEEDDPSQQPQVHDRRKLLHYVDLAAMDDEAAVMDRMVHVGLSLLANHPTVRLTAQPQSPLFEIAWMPEGKTGRLLRRLTPLSAIDRLEVLKTETLLWSGKFRQNIGGGGDRDSRFYLARGILPLSPQALLALLWDNERTQEYNKFCLGRTTLMGEDKLNFGKDRNDETAQTTKVIQSETRVPLTSLSVKVQCLMHARTIPAYGYVIISRSCTAGPAGSHTAPLPNLRRSPSEIQWGINLLRTVPHRPDLVDLTSLSQVSTVGVPPFLSQKIALLGVQGFFEKARQLE